MASAIDPTKPVEGTPTTASVRDNFAAAKSEIETLQATAGIGPKGVSLFAWNTVSALTNISQIPGMAVGDYAVNVTAAALNMLGIATQPGGMVRSTSATAANSSGSIRGPAGAAANVSVGTTTTVDPAANANVTQGGTPDNRTFSFQIPRGAQGVQGTPGLGAGGLALTSGGTLGQKLVKRTSVNGDAQWVGMSEHCPIVIGIVHVSGRWVVTLDRPAPPQCVLVFHRFTKRMSGTDTSSSWPRFDHQRPKPKRAWRAIFPWLNNGGFPYVAFAPGTRDVNLPPIHQLWRPGPRIRSGGIGNGPRTGHTGWGAKSLNPYLNIFSANTNKVRYKFGTCVDGDWQRRGPMSVKTFEVIFFVNSLQSASGGDWINNGIPVWGNSNVELIGRVY